MSLVSPDSALFFERNPRAYGSVPQTEWKADLPRMQESIGLRSSPRLRNSDTLHIFVAHLPFRAVVRRIARIRIDYSTVDISPPSQKCRVCRHWRENVLNPGIVDTWRRRRPQAMQKLKRIFHLAKKKLEGEKTFNPYCAPMALTDS